MCGITVARTIAAMVTATATSPMSTNSMPPGLRAAAEAAAAVVLLATSWHGQPKHHRNLSRLVVAHCLLEPGIFPATSRLDHLN